MDRQELIDNLGTVARSGTRAFVERLAEGKEGAALIGQFGVGFYSAFMVADRIEVISRRAGSDEVWVWHSSGESGFEISPATEEQAERVPRGTEVTLHLKEDAKKYLESYDIQRIVKTYSDHILFPIELVGKEGEPHQINTASAIWQRPKSELRPDDYTQAYRSITGAFDEPAMTLHYRAEGRQSYAVLLFAPSSKPFDMFDEGRKARVKLYVRRVYITDDAELLPSYLRFVRGVIDSEDMPLNISREMLQNNPLVEQIRKAVTSRVVAELATLAEKEADKFTKIWDTFGRVLKEGIYEDHERHGQILALARSPPPRAMRRARSGNTWLICGRTRPRSITSWARASSSCAPIPKLEAARARGIEVLLLTDPVDALWTSMPQDHEGKPLKSLSQGEVDFSLVPLLEEAAPAQDDAGKPGAVDDETPDRRGQGSPRRARFQRARLDASDRRFPPASLPVPGFDREALAPPCPPEPRRRAKADTRAQHAPSHRAGRGARQGRCPRGGGHGPLGAAVRAGKDPRRRGAGPYRSLCEPASTASSFAPSPRGDATWWAFR